MTTITNASVKLNPQERAELQHLIDATKREATREPLQRYHIVMADQSNRVVPGEFSELMTAHRYAAILASKMIAIGGKWYTIKSIEAVQS